MSNKLFSVGVFVKEIVERSVNFFNCYDIL